LEVSFLDVGQGDAAVLSIFGKEPLVIDTGPGSGSGKTIARHLSSFTNQSSEFFVALTHPHQDHTGGMPYLSESFPHAREIRSGRYQESGKQWFNSAIEVGRGQALDWNSESRIYVLHPPSSGASTPINHVNDDSVVLLVVFGQIKFLLLGDVEKSAESQILDTYAPILDVDVVKVAHHGSKTSSSPPLIAATHPLYAIVSVGANNRFSHPDKEILERWIRSGTDVKLTSHSGAITFRTDGRTLKDPRSMISDQ